MNGDHMAGNFDVLVPDSHFYKQPQDSDPIERRLDSDMIERVWRQLLLTILR